MESIKKFISDTLAKAAIIYLLITIVITGFCELGNLSGTMGFGALLMILIFSLLVAWGLKLFNIKSISYPLALLIHYGITVVSGYITFTVVGRIGHELGMVIIISFIYAIIALISSIIRHFYQSSVSEPTSNKVKSKKKQEYKKQFR